MSSWQVRNIAVVLIEGSEFRSAHTGHDGVRVVDEHLVRQLHSLWSTCGARCVTEHEDIVGYRLFDGRAASRLQLRTLGGNLIECVKGESGLGDRLLQLVVVDNIVLEYQDVDEECILISKVVDLVFHEAEILDNFENNQTKIYPNHHLAGPHFHSSNYPYFQHLDFCKTI